MVVFPDVLHQFFFSTKHQHLIMYCNTEGGFRFPDEILDQEKIIACVEYDFNMLVSAVNSPVHLRELSHFLLPIVKDAQQNILQNMHVVLDIAGKELDGQDMADFFDSVALYEYGGAAITAILAGLSAMDGSRAYINEALLQTDNRFQRSLEHEYMHNISRWRNPDSAGRISPSENANLISLDNGKKIEAGN